MNEDLTFEDALDYLGREGRSHYFHIMNIKNMRVGQAWFNTLPHEDAMKLRGKLVDPFHRDKKEDIVAALKYLLNS